METSDSEYFESADEDFCSDDEQTGKTQDKKRNSGINIKDKLEDLSINDNWMRRSIDESDEIKESKEKLPDEEKKDSGSIVTNSKNKATILEKTDQSIGIKHEKINIKYEHNDNKNKPQNTQNSQATPIGFNIPPAQSGDSLLATNFNQHKSNVNETKEDNSSRPKTYIPPAVSSSGFSGEKTNDEPSRSYKLLGNLENKSEGTKNDKQSDGLQRPEFGIPPAIVTCWEPGTANITKQFKPHPAYDKLIENRKENIKRDTNSDISNMSQQPKRPEFGIPPARTTCWVPGVTRTDNINTSFEPHPAYIQLMKEKAKNFEESLERPNELTQEVANTDNSTQSIPSKSIEKPKEDTEENMWNDEDDWGDFDIPTKQEEKRVESEDKEKLVQKENKDDENMWEEDDWEPIEPNSQYQNSEKPKSTIQSNQEKSSWGGWGNWGLSSVISTATTLTSHVSQGITNVLETGIGAPDPAELAKINKLEKEKLKEMASASNEELPPEKSVLGFGLGNLVQGVTKLVETTGTKVISGGLDTLETIGKKTMEVLQENDPGLKKKRAFLKLDDNKPILSQILREAKEKSEKENKELEKKHFAKKANYETLFDDHQGLVHLEALEMLSKQCSIKLQSLLESTSTDALNDMQETLDQVKELCELSEEDDEETLSMEEIKERLESAVSEINVKITYNKLLTTWQEVEDWLGKLNLKICNKNELHQQAIESLAQLTAIAVEQFHKAGELLLIKDHRSTADEADSLVQLTTTLTSLIGIVAARFSEKLNLVVAEGADKEEVNSLITNVFFEAANSSSYIQDAFQLLIPVLQVGAV